MFMALLQCYEARSTEHGSLLIRWAAERSAAIALRAEHDRQLGSESLLSSLMAAKD
jgi:hypothetical protein